MFVCFGLGCFFGGAGRDFLLNAASPDHHETRKARCLSIPPPPDLHCWASNFFAFFFGLFELCLVSIKGIHLFPSEPWRETNLSPKIKTKHQTKKKEKKEPDSQTKTRPRGGESRNWLLKAWFFCDQCLHHQVSSSFNPKRPPSQSNKKKTELAL